MRIDVLYLAWNRLAFTEATFAWMISHTNWRLVRRLVIYDDGSEDGTLEYLREMAEHVPCRVDLRSSDLRSPPAIMNHYIATSEANWFAKIDNDIALPGQWLDRLVRVQRRNPEYELIGMEAGMVQLDGRDGVKAKMDTVTPCSHIGGVGFMSVQAFRERPEIPSRGRYGFTEWQNRYDPPRGWITPDIPCPQLDRLPFEPWSTLTEGYIDRGWNRAWQPYDETWMAPYWEWILGNGDE